LLASSRRLALSGFLTIAPPPWLKRDIKGLFVNNKVPAQAMSPASATTVTDRPDPWLLVRHGHDPADFAQDESLFAVANGSLGVRGGLEQGDSPSQGSFLSGVWERTPIEYHERFPGFARNTDTRVPVADGTRIQLRLGDTLVRLDEGEWLAFERVLDMRTGVYAHSLTWRAPTGATLEIVSERMVALDEPGLLAIRYRVRSIDYDGPVTLESSINTARDAIEQGFDPRIGARLDGGLRDQEAAANETFAWVRQQTTHSDIRLVCGQRHRLLEDSLTPVTGHLAPHGVMHTFTGNLAPGEEVALEKYVAYAWSQPRGEEADSALLDRVEASLLKAASLTYPALRETQAWTLERFWNAVDLAVDGDPATEQALRFSLFHVFQSTCRDGTGSAAAKGLTGEGYEGHYFWDAEAFMLPAMVTVAPDMARGMLDFRYRTLERSRMHAREMNHPRGALYAWRTISGDECSSYFPGGSAQYHINAAVAWAIRLYVDATGDQGFMLDFGAEMLFETARIWLDIGHFNVRRDGAFCIHEVTGPDEYSALVDNNNYTNRMAQRHLRDAAGVAQWMASAHPVAYLALVERIGLQADEVTQWERAARHMYLPVDKALNIFPQDDGFLDKPRLHIVDDNPTKLPLLLRLHPLTIYRHQVCKQADTLLGLMLAGDNVDQDAKRRNLEYYEGVTVHDSTLSASTFGVIAAEVGQMQKAYTYFQDSLRVDLDDLHGNAAHGVHMAAMAGSWLGLTWGFGGLRIVNGKPSLSPRLPRAWNGYRFGLRWHSTHLRVEVDASGVLYTLTEGSELSFVHNGEPQTLHAGEQVRLPRVDALVHAFIPRPLKAVIFDLDGVIADTAVVHHAAWQRLAGEIGVPFDDGIGERLKGVDRMASLDIILESASRTYSAEEKLALAERKNSYYRDQVEQLGPKNLLPGARAAIESVRRAGLKTGLASASRNAPLLLQRLGIAELFDVVVDANRISRSKPDPEIFLAAASALGVAPDECLGVEDAAAGIASIRAAGMAAVGIGHAQELAAADVVLPNVAALDIETFITA
jgi:beta-phosphoglucomutase